MSDTTTTITPEERASWRDECKNWMGRDSEIVIRMRLLSALETAQAENARLRAERGWLAENAADRPCAYDSCPFGLHRPTGPDDDDCDKTRAQCWQEAARRAAAAGEGE